MKKIFTISLFILAIFLTSLNSVFAQNAISLSITPPLFELLIQPGKEVKQIYNLSNNGGDTILTPKIVYFESLDEEGNVSLTEVEAPSWVKYSKDPISLKSGAKTDFNVLFSPPPEEEEIDHFLTLVFATSEATDILDQNSALYKTEIGTNMLITISKDGNPKKSAEILEFNAPVFIDSFFSEILYKVKLRNNGNSFWKPNGKIIINNDKQLKLAPLNLISGSTRNIKCLENENLTGCKLDGKFLIGKYVSSLEFSVDEDPKVYKLTTTTYAFPLSAIMVAATTLYLLRRYINRRKHH